MTSMEKVIEHALEGILIHMDYCVLYMNPQFKKIISDCPANSTDISIGSSVLKLFKKEDLDIFKQNLESEKVTRVDLFGTTPVLIRSTPICYQGLECTLTFVQSKQKEAFLHNKLEQSNRMETLGLLSAGVAHEINNPLTYISLSIDELNESLPIVSEQIDALQKQIKTDLPAEQAQKLLPKFEDALSPSNLSDLIEGVADAAVGTQRIADIVQDLKVFSHLNEQKETICLHKAIRSAFQLCRHRVQRKANIQLELGNQIWISADESKIIQVLINLMVNASDAMAEDERGTIHIKLMKKRNTAVIEISDDGSGIPEDIQPHLFSRFFTTKSSTAGSGLGLAITKEIIEQYEGSIDFTSVVGEGTVFSICFPMDKPKTKPITQQSFTKKSNHRYRLLLIEDDELIRRQLTRLLTQEFIVQTAPSGRIGFATIQQEAQPDLIITDLLMPDGSGIDLYWWLKRYHPSLCEKIVYITGGAHDERIQRFTEQVPNIILEKPIPPKQFIQTIRQLCSHPQPHPIQSDERRAGHRFSTQDISGKLYLGSKQFNTDLIDFSYSGFRTGGMPNQINYKRHNTITVRMQNKKMMGEVAAHVQFARLANNDPCFHIQGMSKRDRQMYNSWLSLAA